MRFKLIFTIGIASGALALAVALATPSATGVGAAERQQQVPPRPTLEPTATPLPTATPWPKATSRDEDAPRYGRIAGTVIDQRTGAPSANLKVMVGKQMIMSDSNGNYDQWILIGNYPVALALNDGQGVAAQAAQQVTISAEATTIQHLFFTSPAPAVEAVVAAPTATVAPTATPQAAASVPAVQPERLPTTGSDGDAPNAYAWLALLMVVSGGLLSVRRVRLALLPWVSTGVAPSDDTGLLNALLVARPQHRRQRRTPKADTVLLATLLEREE